jgi:DNA-binding NarL/FixJ family response regulator
MKPETKMAILRILVTKYAKEYEIMKRYFFNNTGFSIRAGELAEKMASEGKTRKEIAETLHISLRTAKR